MHAGEGTDEEDEAEAEAERFCCIARALAVVDDGPAPGEEALIVVAAAVEVEGEDEPIVIAAFDEGAPTPTPTAPAFVVAFVFEELRRVLDGVGGACAAVDELVVCAPCSRFGEDPLVKLPLFGFSGAGPDIFVGLLGEAEDEVTRLRVDAVSWVGDVVGERVDSMSSTRPMPTPRSVSEGELLLAPRMLPSSCFRRSVLSLSSRSRSCLSSMACAFLLVPTSSFRLASLRKRPHPLLSVSAFGELAASSEALGALVCGETANEATGAEGVCRCFLECAAPLPEGSVAGAGVAAIFVPAAPLNVASNPLSRPASDTRSRRVAVANWPVELLVLSVVVADAFVEEDMLEEDCEGCLVV